MLTFLKQYSKIVDPLKFSSNDHFQVLFDMTATENNQIKYLCSGHSLRNRHIYIYKICSIVTEH
jgi:hypothetical protein